MNNTEDSLEIANGIYWVGVIDWNLRDFHGYETPKGATYNAYLIIDEKITLIDTVKSQFAEEMIDRIKSIVDPATIDYVVSNHVEMDHSGSLPAVMEIAPNATIFATKRGKAGLCEYYTENGCESWDFETVETGTELDLGTRTLMFIETPMLHWPDSMQTYLKEDRILFSNDAFGQHISTSKRFDDEVDDVMDDAAIYYANILMPFGSRVLKYADQVTELGLEFNMIAPGHGIIWRKDPGRIIDAYVRWASAETVPKVPVIYDTMWGSTERMARAILEGVRSADIPVKLLDLHKNDWSMITKEVMEAPVIAIGSPTMNNNMLPSVAGYLSYLKGLRPKNKKVAIFGSFGWGGGAAKSMETELKAAGFEIIEPKVQAKFRPDKDSLEACRELGIRLAEEATSNQVI
ncbi:MAG: FprA family A-type flavoprotein [Methanosarcinaceae archaeon]|nr:FprA family A-type flavoprotein [Methanosarcinaceae archaeon]